MTAGGEDVLGGTMAGLEGRKRSGLGEGTGGLGG